MSYSTRMTRTDVRNMAAWTGKPVLDIGYCEMQNMLWGVERVGYACGVYGWNYDVFSVPGAIICTGYRAMPGRRPAVDARPYERRAEHATSEERAAILEEFIRAALNQAPETVPSADLDAAPAAA